MSRIFLSLVAVFFLAKTLPAQITLSEILQRAGDNSSQIRKARLDRQAVEARLGEGRAAALPQISINGGLDYYPQLPTTLLPGDLFGHADGSVVPVQFNQPWQLGGELHVEQMLYNQAAIRLGATVDASRSLADLLVARSEEEVTLNTATVFYQFLQAQQMLRAVDANEKKLAELQRLAELQLANDYGIATDVKRVKVARTNLQAQRQSLQAGINALRQTLQFLSGVPFDDPFEPVDDLSNIAADSSRLLALQPNPEGYVEQHLLQQNITLNRLQMRSRRAEGRPTLSAYATAALRGQNKNANLFSAAAHWYGVAAIGLKVLAPLPLRRGFKTALLEIENQKLAEDQRQIAQAKALEFRQAQAQIQVSLANLRAQSDNIALAKEVYDKLNLQFKEGTIGLPDLLNAQTALAEAEGNYWKEVYNYKLAGLKLLKAAGRLNELKHG